MCNWNSISILITSMKLAISIIKVFFMFLKGAKTHLRASNTAKNFTSRRTPGGWGTPTPSAPSPSSALQVASGQPKFAPERFGGPDPLRSWQRSPRPPSWFKGLLFQYVFENEKLQAWNLVFQGMIFHVQNALKLTYEHLRFQKIFRRLYPRTPVSRGASSNSAGRGAYNAGKEGDNTGG